MHEIMMEFRKKFSDIIAGYEALFVIRDYKYTFLPEGAMLCDYTARKPQPQA